MIQRIQTLFLLAAVICGVILFFIPVASAIDANGLIFVTGIEGSTKWYLHLIFYPCIILPFAQIFMFKNRVKQIKIGKLAIAYWIIWAVIFVILSLSIDNLKPSFGTIIPLLSILFIYLANKAIKKDEDLVRSIDRIR
ncbi:MAG TPA: DUF4293 domain-containing protein [Salinivirgaceae bacterium]|nr:DUF4293 domain-containing protein [Salinivirgaceae bacterium]HQA76270.1 DUF4293 domain-containing protein [Salinivirgaceae bacterium]